MTSSDPARRAVRRTLFPAVEQTWAAGAWAGGRLSRAYARATPWASAAGGRILVIAAHPDDETIGAGGTIALHAAAGDDVTIAVVTDGSASRAGGLNARAMARRRTTEAQAAAAALGVETLIWLGLVEGSWDEAEAGRALRPLVDEATVVYAPSVVDYHPEHAAVAHVTAGLVTSEQLVRVYEVGVPLTPVLANFVADITEVAAAKGRALAAYESQRSASVPLERLQRYRARMYRLDASEVFWQLPGDAYSRVTALGDWRGGRTPFRGIRERPFTDPLSALVGLRRRLELGRAAMAG